MIVIFTQRLLLSSVITRVPLVSLKSPGAKEHVQHLTTPVCEFYDKTADM